MSAGDRFGRSLFDLWETVPEEGGRPLRVWALLDSGEYASAEWDGGGPEAGWFDLVAELGELRFQVGPSELDAQTFGERVERPAIWTRDVDMAFIAEAIDEDRWQPAGRFEVHLERAGGGFQEGPRSDDLRAAFEWARERAARVQFRPEGTNHHFTLGPEPVPETPEWPWDLDIRPRPDRTPLDGSVTTRPWPLLLTCSADRSLPPFPPELEVTVVDHVAGAQGWTAMVDVVAASSHAAILPLAEWFDASADAGAPSVEITYSSDFE